MPNSANSVEWSESCRASLAAQKCSNAASRRAAAQTVPVWSRHAATAAALARRSSWQRALFQSTSASRDLDADGNAVDSGLAPTRASAGLVLHSVAMAAWEKGARWPHAVAWLSRLRHQRNSLDVVVCSSALSACGKGMAWTASIQILGADLQTRARLAPNVVAFCAACNGCGKGWQWDTALSLLRVMRRQWLQPNMVLCNAIGSACAKALRWRWVLEAFISFSRQLSCDPNGVSYSGAASGCEMCREWYWALYLVSAGLHVQTGADATGRDLNGSDRTARKNGTLASTGVEGDASVLWNAAMSACAKKTEWQWAGWLIEGMRQQLGLRPDVVARALQYQVSHCAAISSCERGLQWEFAASLFKKMRRAWILPDLVACNSLLSSCEKAQKWGEAMVLLDQTRRELLRPDSVTVDAAMRSCTARAGWSVLLHLLLDAAHTHEDCSEDYFAACAVITDAFESGRQELRAVDLLANMQLRATALGCAS